MDRGLEGIVAKRKDSIYQPGKRSSAWQKIKAVQSAEFVIGGYTKGKGAREPLGALLLGYFDKKDFHYVGHVGSGLDEKTFADLRARVAKLTRKTRPSRKSSTCTGRRPGSNPNSSPKSTSRTSRPTAICVRRCSSTAR